ncbi:MAG: type II toxin-antitoxin system VapC family toxin [Microscillaceae bacterium]|jgi:predicted nucleic acid-binding protein|nr:type II toxin-antitoxin system VapC family toxin [Microscillaceae bacterium]
MIILDANILLRYKEENSAQHIEVREKVEQLFLIGEVLVLAPQSLYEFYVVATRPKSANGLGMDKKDVLIEIQDIKSTFNLLSETKSVYGFWEKLIENFEINGKTAHDARIVAFMQAHQIKKLYTLNVADFQRFTSLIELV